METSSNREIADYYDKCHNDYRLIWGAHRYLSLHYGFTDELHRRHGATLLNMNAVLSETAGIGSDDHVLDAGCGIGGSAIWLAKNVGARVTGITISARQAKLATLFARKAGVQRLVKFYVRDYLDTKFLPGNFDVVWALESVCYARDKSAFVREAWRILKDGGRIVVGDGFYRKSEHNIEERHFIDLCLSGWTANELTTIAQFKKYLIEAGFGRVNHSNITRNVTPSSKKLYWAGVVCFPVGKALELLRLRSEEQTKNMISAIYQYRSLKRGLWAYCIFSAEKN